MSPAKDALSKNNPAEPHVRIAELITLQRRLLKTMDAQTLLVTGAAQQAEAATARAVDKLIRLDADRQTFEAIGKTIWDAVGAGPLLTLLRDTAARDALAKLERREGAYQTVQAGVEKDAEKNYTLRARRAELLAGKERFDKKLAPVRDHNARGRQIDLSKEKQFRETGFFARSFNFDEYDKQAYAVYSAYNGKNSNPPHYQANLFDDIRANNAVVKELEETDTALQKLHAAALKRATVLAEFETLRRDLDGTAGNKAPDYDRLRDELSVRLQDGNFLDALTRHTPSGFAGPIILAGLKASALKDVAQNLNTLHEEALETLAVLEGPVLGLARAQNRLNAVEIVEQDTEVLAALGGYSCINAAAVVSALETFQPDHTDGAQSLRRELQMHLALNGHVDPAYICDTLGMDRLTAGYFNIDPLAVKPNLAATLKDTSSVGRTDRRFAAFLSEMADGDRLNGVSFGNVRVDSDAFAAIMIATKPDLPAAAQFAKLAALAKQTIDEARRAYVDEEAPAPAAPAATDEPVAEAETDGGGKKGKKRGKDKGPQPG